jgi:hypothetical protein
MKRITLLAAMLASTVLSAAAQDKTPMQNIEDARRNERLEVDRQYEAARRARERPAQAVTVDPWASVRTADQPAKTPKKKTPAR